MIKSRALSPVPLPELQCSVDIKVYNDPDYVPIIFGTSLSGKRSAQDFLALLKIIICPDDFCLKSLKEGHIVQPEGKIKPGDYILAGPSKLYLAHLVYSFRRELELVQGVVTPDGKRKRSSHDKAEGARSRRDYYSEESGFKSRLIARDRGCVVCLAQNLGEDARYLFDIDSVRFVGAHIFPTEFHALWDKKGYSQIVVDPYSVPGASKSSTSRLTTDTRRMNSIDNGLLLCLQHHSDFVNHLFSIHPDTHIITSFHFRTRSLSGVEVGQPWTSSMDKKQYPPPHRTLLYDHFRASIGTWMMAASDEYEEEDTLEDQDEVQQQPTSNSCRHDRPLPPPLPVLSTSFSSASASIPFPSTSISERIPLPAHDPFSSLNSLCSPWGPVRP